MREPVTDAAEAPATCRRTPRRRQVPMQLVDEIVIVANRKTVAGSLGVHMLKLVDEVALRATVEVTFVNGVAAPDVGDLARAEDAVDQVAVFGA